MHLFIGYRGSWGVEWLWSAVDQLLCLANAKNEWSYTSPPRPLMACRGTVL